MRNCSLTRAIETNTVALLDSLYSKEKADGKIIYKVIDISKKENEAIADKYEVTWSSLFVNGWKDGKENVNNMTEFSFSNAKNAPRMKMNIFLCWSVRLVSDVGILVPNCPGCRTSYYYSILHSSLL